MSGENLVLFVNLLVIGVFNGGMYVLLGLGLTLLFGVSRIFNMAHGELFAVGGYITFLVATHLGVNPLLGFGAAAVVGYAAGWLLNRRLVAPLRRRPSVETPLEFFLILTLGVSLFMQNALLAVFGPRNLETPPAVLGTIVLFDQIYLTKQRVLIAIVTALAVVALFLFLKRTKTGTAIRAASEDRDAARSMGIDVERLDSLVFGLSAALAAAAGALITAVVFLYPGVGSTWMLNAIVVVIVGGLGSPLGTLIAGYGLGVLEAVSLLVLPTQLKTIAGLLLMILILVFKPSGLLGRRLESEG